MLLGGIVNRLHHLCRDDNGINVRRQLLAGLDAVDECRPSKPDPYGVKMICSQCGRKLDSVIYVGDGYSDILTAKRAGIPCVFVTWGQGNLDDCKEYKDSLIVNDILELERALMNLL